MATVKQCKLEAGQDSTYGRRKRSPKTKRTILSQGTMHKKRRDQFASQEVWRQETEVEWGSVLKWDGC